MAEEAREMIYIQLFLGFMYIGVLAFGGGYAALPLIQQTCVEQNGWLSMTEFSDLLTISQITPGPIAINSASFVGMKAAGFAGSVVASLLILIIYKRQKSSVKMKMYYKLGTSKWGVKFK